MIKCKKKIAILMSTYNGALYLHEQIESIIAQNFKDWVLYIRDDGSSDETLDILQGYVFADSRIVIYKDERGNIGTRASFMTLLENICAEYYSFADQDDVWLPNKLLEAITYLEKYKNRIALFNSNVTVVDSQLNVILDDYWKNLHIDPSRRFMVDKLIINPSIIGMTMVFNNKARDIVIPYRGVNLLHDSWCSIMIAKNGVLISSKKQSVLYRQHSKNVCGLNRLKKRNLFSKLVMSLSNNIDKYKDVKRLFDISLFQYFILKLNLYVDYYKYNENKINDIIINENFN